MDHTKVIRLKKGMMVFSLSILVGIFALALPARGALIILDNFEGDSLNADITDVFRTPTVGPPFSAAWYEPRGSATARVVEWRSGKAARLEVPQGTSLDYIAYLGAPCVQRVFLISWDMQIAEVNGGWGMFLIRFSRYPTSMQVLFGFFDDGRVIRFAGEPSVESIVTVGTFTPGIPFTVQFLYDLTARRYSAAVNGVWLVNREPIPDHFDLTTLHRFGFDVNQLADLPEHPPQGNVYYVDNIRLTVMETAYLPLIIRNLGGVMTVHH